MHVFASCSSYTLGQLAGSGDACALISRACADLDHEQLLPAVHALRELRRIAEVELRVDGGAQCVAKARSRHFHAALQSSAEAWLTIDDDLDTTRETLALLLAAVEDGSEPRVCFAPYAMRNDPTVAAVEWSPVIGLRTIVVENDEAETKPSPLTRRVDSRFFAEGEVRRALRGGFGLVAMNRAAMLLVATSVPSFRDDDGVMKPAAFLEYIDERSRWLGEDFAFFERARAARVLVEALITGETTHAGTRLKLETLR